MKLDLGCDATVMGVVIEHRKDCDQHVTKFTIQHSLNGSDWCDLYGEFQASNRRVRVGFYEHIHARYVKIVVAEWHGHISMRAGVLVKADTMWSVCDGVECFPGQTDNKQDQHQANAETSPNDARNIANTSLNIQQAHRQHIANTSPTCRQQTVNAQPAHCQPIAKNRKPTRTCLQHATNVMRPTSAKLESSVS